MLVVSYGLPKSASTFVFQLTKLLVEQAGFNQATVRQKYVAPGLRQEFIHLTPPIVDELMSAVPSDQILIVKTHAGVGAVSKFLSDPRLKVTVSVRDPRDAILSAIETGAKERREPSGRQAFAQFRNARSTIPAYRRHCINTSEWLDVPGALKVRYTDVVNAPASVSKAVVDYLAIPAQAQKAADWLTEKKASRITEFSVGKEGRAKETFSTEDLALIEHELGEYIERFS